MPQLNNICEILRGIIRTTCFDCNSISAIQKQLVEWGGGGGGGGGGVVKAVATDVGVLSLKLKITPEIWQIFSAVFWALLPHQNPV